MEKVSRQQAKAAVQKAAVTETDDSLDMSILEAKEKQVLVAGLAQKFDLRKTWSNWIIAWITGLVVFHTSLTIAVGLGCVNFKEMQWFITAVTVETFLQVIGLGYVAAKFLFSDTANLN